jgi:hypothetical protein
MDDSQVTDENAWFDGRIEDDSDFPSGKCVGTSVINGKCAFLDSRGRCSIQRAAVEEGFDKWAWKPLYCVLFPLDVSDGVIRFDDLLQNDQRCCSTSTQFSTPLFESCHEELIHIIGADGLEEMRKFYRENIQREQAMEPA